MICEAGGLGLPRQGPRIPLKAEDMFADGWPDEAGRAAYLAGLHAAQAVIVERTGRIIKRHRGVRNELRRLMKDEPRFDFELSAFLARA